LLPRLQAQLTGNLGLTSDYRFRGVSQTQNAPAVQGGIDYAHSSGLYIGNWNSSVSSQVYTAGAGVENDLYAGYKKEVLQRTSRSMLVVTTTSIHVPQRQELVQTLTPMKHLLV
jgi:uncharacterized protein (TIGR02001 family)